MNGTRANPDFVSGVPELLVLQLLARRAMHGYQLVQSIRSETGQALSFGEGSIYPLLHRLEAEGCLISQRQEVAGRSRVVYHVTREGHARLARSKRDWLSVAQAVRRVLEGGEHGLPPLGPVLAR